MSNDDFLAKCKSIDPSAEVDRIKNLAAIKNRLLKEEEQYIMLTNKKIRRPAIAAVLLTCILSLSVAVYAAAPIVWRYFDTRVIQGGEFVNDFFVGEVDLPDGTTSIGGNINIDREALEAAGGGAVIVEVDGEEWVILDELHLNNLEEALALLEIETPLLPQYLPKGFAFSSFVFPVNPLLHEKASGSIISAEFAYIYYSDGNDTIRLQIMSGMENLTLWATEDQQALLINTHEAVLMSGVLTDEELARLDGVMINNYRNYELNSIGGTTLDESKMISLLVNGVGYSLFTQSINVSNYDLVKIAASLR